MKNLAATLFIAILIGFGITLESNKEQLKKIADDAIIVEQTEIIHKFQGKTDKNSQLIVQTAQGKIDAIVQKREQEAKGLETKQNAKKEPMHPYLEMAFYFGFTVFGILALIITAWKLLNLHQKYR